VLPRGLVVADAPPERIIEDPMTYWDIRFSRLPVQLGSGPHHDGRALLLVRDVEGVKSPLDLGDLLARLGKDTLKAHWGAITTEGDGSVDAFVDVAEEFLVDSLHREE
jgi:hypothetical protein